MQLQTGRPTAMACVRGENGIRGVVRFCARGDGVLVTAEVFGLDDGFHGFHIHAGTSCGGTDFSDALGHYNPGKTEHPNHAGDLPSLLSCGGKAYLTVLTNRFRVCDILGRVVIVHRDRDDFTTQPSGDSGPMIACGVIESC